MSQKLKTRTKKAGDAKGIAVRKNKDKKTTTKSKAKKTTTKKNEKK